MFLHFLILVYLKKFLPFIWVVFNINELSMVDAIVEDDHDKRAFRFPMNICFRHKMWKVLLLVRTRDLNERLMFSIYFIKEKRFV